jgi:hypothetical protein
LIEHHRDQGDTVLINATGGFKAQIAYATLLGILYRVEVNYIHEDFGDIIQLPLVPISYDLLMWRQYGPLLGQLLSVPDLATARSIRKRLPREFDMLLQEVDGGFEPTAAGYAYYRAFDRSYREVELQRRDAIKTSGDHKSVWGLRHIGHVNDIPDEEVRILLRRLLSFNFAKQVILGRWDTKGAKQATYLTLRNTKPGAVEYKLNCRAGWTQVVVVVQEGMEDLLVEMVGQRAHP